MSTPENPLAKYRSYSYHHILIACDNEAAARFIRGSNAIDAFRQIGTEQQQEIPDQTLKLRPIPEIDETTGKETKTRIGAYVVILNGMVDTTYVVRDVEWFTATATSTDKHDRFT